MSEDVSASELQGIGLFSGVGPEDLGFIAEHCKREHFRPGQLIVEEGDPSERLYVITDGEAKLYSRDGVINKRMGRGGLIGELAAFDPAPRSVSIEAISDVAAISLSTVVFLAILDHHSGIARAVFKVIVRRLRDAENRSREH